MRALRWLLLASAVGVIVAATPSSASAEHKWWRHRGSSFGFRYGGYHSPYYYSPYHYGYYGYGDPFHYYSPRGRVHVGPHSGLHYGPHFHLFHGYHWGPHWQHHSDLHGYYGHSFFGL